MMGATFRAKHAIRVLRLPHAVGLPLPAYAHDTDAGLDLLAAVMEPESVEPGDRLLVPTGLRVEVPEGFSLDIRPRSGLALKHGITVLNAPGTIDPSYRGEVQVLLYNAGVVPFPVERGMRIAQAVLSPVYQVEWEEVDALDDTARGTGGFGSSGIHAPQAHTVREKPDA